jgi:hypothetical protein
MRALDILQSSLESLVKGIKWNTGIRLRRWCMPAVGPNVYCLKSGESSHVVSETAHKPHNLPDEQSKLAAGLSTP